LRKTAPGEIKMKKSIQLTLSDEDLIELMRILLDEDAEGALAFLRNHFKGKARELLEGG
jgi:hypothetical protein